MNNSYLYISSRKNIKEYLLDNFKNTTFIRSNPYKFQLKKILRKIKKNNIKQVIIEDYFVGIKYFISKLNVYNIPVKMVWTKGLATLNEEIELGNLLEIIDLLKDEKIKSLAFTEKNIYYAYQDVKGVNNISLTVNSKHEKNDKKTKLIGIYGISDNWISNIFNQISAIKFLDSYELAMLKMKKVAKRFCRFFDIKYNNCNKKMNVVNFRKMLGEVQIASCVEFTNLFDLFIIDSFNYNVPCIIGNNSLFFKDTKLEDMIVVKSDDDVNEIAEKMKYCLNNNKNICLEYKKIKKKYDIESRKSIKNFIEE